MANFRTIPRLTLAAHLPPVLERVMRGGHWGGFTSLRASERNAFSPWTLGPYAGFRVALPVDAVKGALSTPPLSPMALVTEPAAIEGVKSWTVDTIHHRGPIYQATFSPDGKLLATLGGDATVRIWDPTSGKLLRALVLVGASTNLNVAPTVPWPGRPTALRWPWSIDWRFIFATSPRANLRAKFRSMACARCSPPPGRPTLKCWRWA